MNEKADPDCKWCNGYGSVNVGTICTGFGGEPESIDCMCITYKAIGFKKDDKGEWYNPKEKK
jgi:hypothetical protein